MQFRDLNAQYNALKRKIDRRIQEVISGCSFILGKEVSELECRLAEYVGVKHCITCASGTDALILALDAFGVKEGDGVFAPDFTFFATVNSAMRLGAIPIPVDIDKDTFNICPDALERAIQSVIKEGKITPKAIITVDLFGLPANYDKICSIADKYGLILLEDAAQGFGGAINGKRRAGSFGDVAATSFFPAKPLGCYGDGGAIFTDSDELDAKLRSLRAQGRSPLDKYDNLDIGYNSRLDTLQAAILLEKLEAFKEYELDSINDAAKTYSDELSSIVKTPSVPTGYTSSWAQYTILLKDESERDALKKHLKENGVPSMVYYPRGMHQQTALKKYGFDKGEFPDTEYVVKRCLSLPIHPYITDSSDIYTVIEKVKEFFKV